MPALEPPRHEALAVAWAKGATLREAFEDAVFPPDRAHADRLAKRDDVTARIGEPRAAREKAEDSEPLMIIDALIRMARAGEALKTPAALEEARLNPLVASRPRAALAEPKNKQRFQISKVK